MKKFLCLLIVICLLTGTVPSFATGYVYTQDGKLYSLEYEKQVADNVKSYDGSYVLKNDNTLWVKLKEMFYITDNVKEYKTASNAYAVIKFDNSLWVGNLNHADIECVMENVKNICVDIGEVLCVTYDNKLYSIKFKYYTADVLGDAELIMENVENVWTDSGRYYVSKTDGSFWAWGTNAVTYYPPGYNPSPYVYKSLLGLGDEYEDINYQSESVKMDIENVSELYFMESYRVAAKTKNDDLYFWGYREYSTTEAFGALFPITNKPIKMHENVKEIKDRSVITNDGSLYWRYWHKGEVSVNVSDAGENVLLTNDGKLCYWEYVPYNATPAKITPILENVKEIADKYDYKVLCLLNDTTLVEVDTRSLNVTSIAANVKEAFYYGNVVYFIDNGFTLYKVDNGNLVPLLNNAVTRIVPIRIVVDGKKLELDTNPYIKNDRTMVPIRAIFEALGAEVTWDNETKTAIGVKDETEVKITIGENVMYKKSEAIELDATAEITNDRTTVPVRAISEAFGCTVGWNNETKTVEITS